MQLTVKQKDRLVSQLQFVKGPVHIGRHPQSQVFLPHPSVSRQHAVVFQGQDGTWRVRDLQSANKTLVNNKAVTDVALHNGDRLTVGEYSIEVGLNHTQTQSPTPHLEDTQAPIARQSQVITRALDDVNAPPIRIAPQRGRDLSQLMFKVTRGGNSAEMLNIALDVLLEQFQAFRVWCALRYDPQGYAEEEGGRTCQGEPFVLQHEVLTKLIEEAGQKRQFILLSHIKQHVTEAKEQSAIIAPILTPDRVMGEIYMDSKPGMTPFSMADLDYAMLVAINLAVVIENF